MAKKGFLESVNIPVPCEKDWEKMKGDEQKRYCSGCEKNVYNISAMPRKAAKKLIAQNAGSLCIRYARLPNGQVMTADRKLHQISRRSSAIAAGVLAATLTLSAMTQAQQRQPAPAVSLPSVYSRTAYQEASLILTVSDEMNAVIPGVQVTLMNEENKKAFSVLTNEEGNALFAGLPDGKYLVTAAGLGFAEYQGIVEVNNQKKAAVKITLKVNQEFLMGDVVIAQATISTGKKSVESKPIKNKQNKNSSETSQISFTVSDSNGAIIPGIRVNLTNQKTQAEFSASTDQDGVAHFSLIPHGRYDVLATSSIGFIDYKQVVQIKEPIEPNIKIIMQVGVISGGMSIDWSEIPLFQAIAQEDNETVKQVVTSGFDVNTKDNAKRTALHIAVEHENLEMVRFLLERGAKVNVRDQAKRTPILMLEDNLSEESSIEILKLLIAHGSDVNIPGQDKSTLLMEACEDDNLEVVKILLEAKADPNLKDEDGETALEKTYTDEIKHLLQSYGAH